MVNRPLIRPYLLGGGSLGEGTLGSHDSYPQKHLQCSKVDGYDRSLRLVDGMTGP